MWFFIIFFFPSFSPPSSSFSSSTFFNEGEMMHFLWGCRWVSKCWWGVVTWRRCARDPLSVWVCVWISPTALKLSLTHTRKNKKRWCSPLWPLLEYIFNKIRFQTGGKFLVVVLQTATCAASHVIYPSIKTKCGTCSTLLEILRHLYIYSLYHIVKDSFDTWEWIPLKEESGNHVNCVIIAWDVCINCGESVLEVFAAASEGLCERRCGLFKCDNVLQVETVIFNHEEVWKEKNIKDI